MIKGTIASEHVRTLINICRVGDSLQTQFSSVSGKLIELGVLHGVGAYCFKKYKDSSDHHLESLDLGKWKQFYLQTSIKYQQKFKIYKLIKVLLEQEGIPIMALKGMALASGLYCDEGTRPMGDLDILVPEGKGLKALEILMSAGAETSTVPRSKLHEQVHSHVRVITLHGVLVEIHQRLFALGSTFCERSNDYFNQSHELIKQDVGIKVLNNLYMAYHLVAHAAVGIEMGGLRLGWLLDIALLWSKEEDKFAFMNAVIKFKANRCKELTQVFQMSSLFLSKQDQKIDWNISEEQLIEDIATVMMSVNVQQKHRWVNLKEILRTPGLGRKAKLLFREFVPDVDYMRYKYHADEHDSVIHLYLKRFFRF